MHTTKTLAVPLALLSFSLSQGVLAEARDEWQFEVTPYIFAAGMEGDAGIRGVTADIDMSFSDIMDNFEEGFMGLFTAQKGPWSFGLEGVYFKIGDEGSKTVTGPFGKVSVSGALELTSKIYVYQGSVGYRMLDESTALDLIGALRYTKLEVDAEATIVTVPGIVFPGGTRRGSGSESWTDAVVGVRAIHPLTDSLSLLGYADVGAGGSDLTYQWILGANWEFKEDLTAKLGYRSMTWDYDEDGTVWDITTSGPYLGLGVRF